MHPVFSLNGQHVAWLFDNFMYNIAGKPIAYASGSGLYAINSAEYIGQLESGEYYTWRTP